MRVHARGAVPGGAGAGTAGDGFVVAEAFGYRAAFAAVLVGGGGGAAAAEALIPVKKMMKKVSDVLNK